MRAKPKPVKKRDIDRVSSGEPMVAGRGGIGIDKTELPADEMSKAERGRVETELEDLKKQKQKSQPQHKRKPRLAKSRIKRSHH